MRSDSRMMTRITREVEMLSQMNHENVVRYAHVLARYNIILVCGCGGGKKMNVNVIIINKYKLCWF